MTIPEQMSIPGLSDPQIKDGAEMNKDGKLLATVPYYDDGPTNDDLNNWDVQIRERDLFETLTDAEDGDGSWPFGAEEQWPYWRWCERQGFICTDGLTELGEAKLAELREQFDKD